MDSSRRILIVDDHPFFRKGIVAVLSAEPGIEVVGEAGGGEEALALFNKLSPDIIILDVNLPGMSGIELSGQIKSISPDTIIILLTMLKEEEIFNKSIDYGIDAYLIKENAVGDLIKAIQITSEGNYYLSSSLTDYFLNRNLKRKKLTEENPGITELTEKEKEILRLIAMNKTTKEIAQQLFVSYKTIENHRANICKKLHISGANALLKFIIENKDKL
ncbi:MAG: response regulator transcription factor [bacterium]